MKRNFKKTLLYIFIPLILVLLGIWGYCETAGSDVYNYQGYVTALRETENGTVVTTISGDKLSEFTLKWYTREKFNGEKDTVEVGDFLKLSTVRGSDTAVKKFSAYDGYSMEGIIVHMDGLNSPFLLVSHPITKAYGLYSLIAAYDVSYPLTTGIQVKVYYQYPLNAGNVSLAADVIQPLSDIPEELTEEALSYIAQQGYTLTEK